jgi:hypothetical protein
MKISINTNIQEVERALVQASNQVPFALSVAMNKSLETAKRGVLSEMGRVFNRPTPWVINSLRVIRSNKSNLTGEIGYKDKNSAESSRSMIEPHVFGGERHYKGMEARLMRAGWLPQGWNAVPGGAAKLDGNGNMSRGQVTQLLNVLGTYTEAGYNKANAATSARLARGNAKKNTFGFVYWVNRVGERKGKHLQPGVYQRVSTAFGTSLKPVLIFVKRAKYQKRLKFFEVAEGLINTEFPKEFSTAFDAAMKSALLKTQGDLL